MEMVATVTGADLVTEARRLLGTRFHWACRSEHAVDCGGVLLVPAKALGLTDYEPPNYGPQTAVAAVHAALWACCRRVDQEWPLVAYSEPQRWVQAGDIGLFGIGKPARPRHLGLFTPVTLIHARQDTQKVVEEPVSGWSSRLVSVWRLKGLYDGAR